MALKLNGTNSVAAPAYAGADADTGLQCGTDEVNLVTGGTARLKIDSSGNVGIGATSINNSYGTNVNIHTSTTNGARLKISDGTSSNGNVDGLDIIHQSGVAYIIQRENNSMRFSTNNAERMRIDSSGKINIGTTSATQKVSVGTSASETIGYSVDWTGSGAGQVASFTANTSTGEVRIGATNSAGTYFPTFYSNNSERMRIDSSGRVMVGTTTPGITSANELTLYDSQNAGLTIRSGSAYSGSILFSDGTSGADEYRGMVQYTHDGNYMRFLTNAVERLRISDTGKFTAPTIYSITTTGGGPVYVEADGDLLRYTSSLKYKTDVETIEDARADAILNCRPVWYRSKCANDIKTEGSEKSDWGWYGFIAEEVAEIEPRLVNWATKDGVKQEDGSVESVERDPADYEAEGVRYDNFVPLLINLVKRQKTRIETLETQNADLLARVTALEAA